MSIKEIMKELSLESSKPTQENGDEGRELVDLKINFLPAIDPDVPPEE